MKKIVLPLLIGLAGLITSCSKSPSAQKCATQWCNQYQQALQYTKDGKYDEATAAFGDNDDFYTETAKKYGNDPKFMEEFQRLTRECKNTYAPERK